jgi:hypothetical protein
LDADCRFDANYLASLETHFREDKKTPACSIYFEHPLCGPLDSKVYEAAALYELHLRYYVQALRFAQFPFAYHTIGSSMAVRASVYEAQGGMNRRQAGEDFYFLHKIIPLGGFTELNRTRVIPSPRASNRVPFGTGKAVQRYLETGSLRSYPLAAFRDLQQFFTHLPEFQPADLRSEQDRWPESVRSFLAEQRFDEVVAEIRRHSTTARGFQKRLFRWFDGFQAMKFVHHARDRFYGESSVVASARELLGALSEPHQPHAQAPTEKTFEEVKILLKCFRDLDRSGNIVGTSKHDSPI